MNKKKLIAVIFLYKLLIMFFALYYLQKHVILGDHAAYINAQLSGITGNLHGILTNSTILTKLIAAFLNSIFFNIHILTDMSFNIIALLGIKCVIDEMDLEINFHHLLFLLILFMPSFNVWSSITGKEAIFLAASGYLAKIIMSYFKTGNNNILNLKAFFVCYLIFLYKPLYFFAMLPVITYIIINSKIKLDKGVVLFFCGVVLLILLTFLYLYNDRLIEFLNFLNQFFSKTARTGRAEILFSISNVIFFLPKLVFLSFWGPTWHEVNTSVDFFAFAESCVIFSAYFVIFLGTLFMSYHKKFMFSHMAILLITLLLLFIVQIPYGLLNAGSAVRYRTDIYLFIWFVMYLISSDWLRACELNFRKNEINNRQAMNLFRY